MCVDLHLNVCELHRAVDADIDGIDLVPATGGGSGPDDPLRSEPVHLGDTVDEVIDAFEQRLRHWLPQVLTVASG
ncbi:MAG: hypothetical protein AAGA90_24310 [Actinomycetota bacterium]